MEDCVSVLCPVTAHCLIISLAITHIHIYICYFDIAVLKQAEAKFSYSLHSKWLLPIPILRGSFCFADVMLRPNI